MLTTGNMIRHNAQAEQLLKEIKPYLPRILGEPGTSLVAVKTEGDNRHAYVLIGSVTGFSLGGESKHAGKVVALSPDAQLGYLIGLQVVDPLTQLHSDWHVYCVKTEAIMGYVDTSGALPT